MVAIKFLDESVLMDASLLDSVGFQVVDFVTWQDFDIFNQFNVIGFQAWNFKR